MSQKIELFHYWRSSCSYRVRWALALKNIPYKSTPINLLKNEHQNASFLQKNPSGLVPSLVVSGEVLNESLAIIEWLEETYPQVNLLPKDPLSRAKVRELSYAIACSIQPIQNLKVMRYISHDQKERAAFAKHWINEGLFPLEAKLQKTAGTYSFGGQITMADLCLVPQIYNALRFNVDMSLYPIANRIYHNCLKTKECEAAAPHNQKGAVP